MTSYRWSASLQEVGDTQGQGRVQGEGTGEGTGGGEGREDTGEALVPLLRTGDVSDELQVVCFTTGGR